MKKKIPEIEPLAIYPQVADYVVSKIKELGFQEICMMIEACSSCAIEGNNLAGQLSTTLQYIMNKQPVGERFVMQLGWFLKTIDETRDKNFYKPEQEEKWQK